MLARFAPEWDYRGMTTSLKQIRAGTTVTAEDINTRKVVTGKVFCDEEGTRRVCGSHEGASFDWSVEHWRNADGSYHDCDAIRVERDADGYFPSWVSVHRIG